MSDELRWTDLETIATRQREAAEAQARNAIIEECARVVDGWRRGYGLKPLAEAIRALKDKP